MRRAVWCFLSLSLAASGSQAAMVQIEVEREGVYHVDAEALRSAGLDPAATAHLRLSHRGAPLAFELTEEMGVTFFAAAPELAHGRPAVYRLEGLSAPSSEPSPDSSSGAPRELRVVSHTVRLEESTIYLPRLVEFADRGTGGDVWVSRVMSAPRGARVEVETPAVAPEGGEVRLRAMLYGHTHLPVTPDHHVVISLNGTEIGDVRWDGQREHLYESHPLDAGLLRDGPNSVLFGLPGDVTGDRTDLPAIDQVYLDWLEISYPHRPGPSGQSFDLPASDRALALAVEGAPELELWTSDGQVRRGAELVVPPQPGLRAVLVSGDVRLSPSRVFAARPMGRDLASPVDYLVVAPEKFLSDLRPLIEHRRSQGLRVLAVSVESVYDEWAYGHPGPEPIREMVRFVTEASGGRTRYLLLVGDADLGYANDPEARRANLMPAPSRYIPVLGRTASDGWYGDLDGDGEAELRIGRFPGRTAREVRAAVAKTLDYERQQEGEWRSRALFVAGLSKRRDTDDRGLFIEGSDELIEEQVPLGMEIERVYPTPSGVTSDHPVDRLPDPDSTRAIVQALNRGVLFAHYYGHGGLNVWEDRQLLTLADVPKIQNRERLPLVFSMSCFTAFFDDYKYACLGEELVNREAGGAVAFWGSSGRSWESGDLELAHALMEVLFNDPPARLGDLLAKASELYLARDGRPSLLEAYILLGDPALELSVPIRVEAGGS